MYAFRKKAVHDKEILFDVELWVQAFKIAGMIILNAMTQVSSPGRERERGRVSLRQSGVVEAHFSVVGLKRLRADGKTAQFVQRNQHDLTLAKVFA